jgi:hypothetical protein
MMVRCRAVLRRAKRSTLSNQLEAVGAKVRISHWDDTY